ncbi:MAG: hypothetical protein P1V20_14735 [Verrucomicrobiales bacterium]|nr:hypothetical protein [Verrucomicrobiales bacterium]
MIQLTPLLLKIDTKHNMKKIFAILLAVTVIPTFHAHAWVGGPFSNNSFTPAGDDGIYEAVAIPSGTFNDAAATAVSGVGLYRWGVNNQNAGGTAFTNGLVGNTSNVNFGGFIGAISSHVWYINGAVYYGVCFGTVNSSIGQIRVVGNATDSTPAVISTPADLNNPDINIGTPAQTATFANSTFQGNVRSFPKWYATNNFQGTGQVNVAVNPTAGIPAASGAAFPIIVFGSRVSFVVTG